jgi:hypothetical protein
MERSELKSLSKQKYHDRRRHDHGTKRMPAVRQEEGARQDLGSNAGRWVQGRHDPQLA